MAKKPRLVKGTLSITQKNYIQNNRHKYSTAELAKRLGRQELIIKAYIQSIDSKGFLGEIPDDEVGILDIDFRKTTKWRQMEEQFTPEEMLHFEEMYYAFMKQFKGNVLTTEEQQIYQVIELAIFMERNKKEQMWAEKERGRIEGMLKTEEEKDPVDQNLVLTDQLVKRLSIVMGSRNTRLEEFNKLLAQQGKILDSLKATRNQRMKAYEDSSKSFVGLIKSLDEPHIKEQIGLHMDALKISMEKALKKLKQPHQYVNQEIDTPITVSEDEDEDTENSINEGEVDVVDDLAHTHSPSENLEIDE